MVCLKTMILFENLKLTQFNISQISVIQSWIWANYIIVLKVVNNENLIENDYLNLVIFIFFLYDFINLQYKINYLFSNTTYKILYGLALHYFSAD